MRPAFYPRATAVLLLVTACLLAQSSSQDPLRSRLDKAKSSYSAAIESAKKKLSDEFEGVVQSYTRAGKLDDAIAVRKERDEFVEKSAVTVTPGDPVTKTEDGWTILFRSNNPLLWNVAVQNSDSYAVPVDRAPRNIRFIRVSRMDTRDFVIASIAAEELASAAQHGAVGWKGDQVLHDNATRLGIFSTQRERGNKGDIHLSKTYSGWGFGARGWLDDRQGYAWNGQPIDATFFEIAVTARDLKADEQKKLLK